MMFRLSQFAHPARSFLAALALFCLSLNVAAAGEVPKLAGGDLSLFGGDLGSGKGLIAGIEMVLPANAHTYWRKSGDSGIAPRFDWAGSDNLAKAEILWPVPQRFDVPDDMTIGYTDRIVWPVRITAKDPARPVTLHLQMDYGICSDICVPGSAALVATLTPKIAEADSAVLQSFLARVPRAPKSGETVSARQSADKLVVSLTGIDDVPALIVEGPKAFWFGKPDVSHKADTTTFAVPFEVTGDAALKDQTVTLTFSGPKTAIEAKVKVN